VRPRRRRRRRHLRLGAWRCVPSSKPAHDADTHERHEELKPRDHQREREDLGRHDELVEEHQSDRHGKVACHHDRDLDHVGSGPSRATMRDTAPACQRHHVAAR